MSSLGRTVDGRRQLDALVESLAGTPYAEYNRAMAEAYLGERDAMYRTLERVADAREVLFMSLPIDPSFVPYHDDAAWQAFFLRHGLRRAPPSPFLTPLPVAA